MERTLVTQSSSIVFVMLLTSIGLGKWKDIQVYIWRYASSGATMFHLHEFDFIGSQKLLHAGMSDPRISF